MILEPTQLDGDELRCQVCIIGGGAAGITLAMELAQRNVDVVLVAGGGYKQTDADRRLNEGVIDPVGSHEPLEQNRRRTFGGGTTVWGGRLVPYEAIDFESRDHVPHSGWPIRYEDVAGRYAEAARLCEVTADDYREAPSDDGRDLPATLDGGAIDTDCCERWSMPTDFGVRYREVLAASSNIRVLIDYHCTNLQLAESLHRASHAQLASRAGRPLQVAADAFVLAAGGMENPRILLASRSQVTSGVGNDHDMVGRCYMSHLAGTHGRVTLHSRRKPSFYRFYRDARGSYSRRRFRLSDAAQRELQVMNVIGFPCRPESGDPSHGDAVLSLLHLLDPRCPVPPGQLLPHLRNVVWNHPAAWYSVVRQVWLRVQSPRLPFILPYRSRAQDELFFQAEHAPNPQSRLLLADERDEFGMPRLTPRVRFCEIDYRTVTAFYRRLDQALRADGLGYLDYEPSELDEYLQELTTTFNSVAHHIGTTRMSADPKSGVVDPDCRVHSVDNLYVAGASVFPTSGHANPTLAILALCLRLVDHLADRFSRPAADLSPVAGTPGGSA